MKWWFWWHFETEVNVCEPPHDKTNNVAVRPAKTQISLGIRPVWSESSLSAWRNLGPSATHWAHCKDSDQTGRMPRLVWVFAGCPVTLLVLSWGSSYNNGQGLFHLTCIIWATSLETLLIPSANNKGSDQLAYPVQRSPISAFVVRCIDSIIATLVKSKISSF